MIWIMEEKRGGDRIQAFKTECLRKLLCISNLKHKTYDQAWSKISFLVGPQEPLLAIVERWKLTWFGHFTCLEYDNLSKTILQGTLECGNAMVAEEMLDRQHQRVDIPARARIAYNGLP